MPRLSIIIPCYNAELTIPRLLESILSQSFEDYEVLAINDGSTDQTAQIISRYASKDCRIRLISISNGGVSRARNIGINHATAPFLTFIDADDALLPDALYTFLRDEDNDCQYMVCQSVYNHHIDTGENSPLFHFTEDIVINQNQNQFLASSLKLLNNGYCFAKMFNTHLLNEKNIRFDEDLHIHEDHLFIFKYLLASDGFKLKKDGGYMYSIGNPSSLSFAVKPTLNYINVTHQMLDVLPDIFKLLNIPNDYQKIVYTDYVGSRIMLEASNAYHSSKQPNKFTFRRYLAVRRKYSDLFKKYYTPPTRKAAILKVIFLYLPILYDFFKRKGIV